MQSSPTFAAPAQAAAEPVMACTFCTKLATDVVRLVAGPGVFICNECVGLCVELIENTPPSAEPRELVPELKLSDEELLAHLPRIAAASTQVEQQLTGAVRQARRQGITWTRIGAALGMTRQSAWERFSGEE
jgi:ClpX C4-type zinc finger